MSAEQPGFTLLPARPGTCEHCAVQHAPEMPHNQQSLFWQYSFYGKNGRWPTWVDAMAHCAPEMKEWWVKELSAAGVIVDLSETPEVKEGGAA